LLDGLSQGAGRARRVIDIDPRDLGLLEEHSAPPQHLWLPKIASGLAQLPRWAILISG